MVKDKILDNDLKLSLLKSGPITMLEDKSSKVVTQFCNTVSLKD